VCVDVEQSKVYSVKVLRQISIFMEQSIVYITRNGSEVAVYIIGWI